MMRISGSIAGVIFLCGVGLSCCAPTQQAARPDPQTPAVSLDPIDFSLTPQHLAVANIADDVVQSIQHGDLRPIGVMGIGLTVPGIERATFGAMNGVRIIPNTGGNVHTVQQMAFQDIAYDYAERYNKLLLTKLPAASTK